MLKNIFLFEAFNSQMIYKTGLDFTQKVKSQDSTKSEYKHMPCYEYVYLFIKNFIPTLADTFKNDIKMAYKKDINSLGNKELYKLTNDSLKVPTEPATMRGLEYVNSKYNLGKIVSVDEAKIGDAISFWVYELITFSTKDKLYSYPDTEAKFNEYLRKTKTDVNKLPEWLIEGATIKYGHYGIISDIDNEYIYLSSSGEKNGVNGIWNGVPKNECSPNYTRLLKSDLRKFQKMSLDDLLFKSPDNLSQKRTQVVLRSYILNFIK